MPTTKKTTTTPTTYAETLAAAEESARTTVETNSANLRRLIDLEPVLATELEEAEDRLAEVEGSFRKLTDEHSLTDYTEAVAAVRRAELRQSGAERAITRAARQQTTTDTSLARIVGGVLEAMLPGLHTLATFVPEVPAVTNVADLPTAVIRQTTPTEVSDRGSLSGEVVVHYWRSALHREIVTTEVEDYGRRHGVLMDVSLPFSSRFGDELRVRVRSAAEETPYLSNVDQWQAQALSSAFAVEVASSASGPTTLAGDAATASYATHRLVSMAGDSAVVSEDIDAEGLRTLVVDGSVLLEFMEPTIEVAVEEAVIEVADDLTGAFIAGAGRVVTWELIRKADSSVALDRDQLVRKLGERRLIPRDISTYGLEPVKQVCFRATLVSTTVNPYAQDAPAA